jgi:hypothetical protein
MKDIRITKDYDISWFEGDFELTKDTIENEILLAVGTNELDSGMPYNLGGWINENIGNRIWILVHQASFTSILKALCKEEIRKSTIDYGNIEFTIINQKINFIEVDLKIMLNDNTIIQREYRL